MKEKKLLRRAAFWLDQFADGIHGAYTTPARTWPVEFAAEKREHDTLKKLATQCRKAGRA